MKYKAVFFDRDGTLSYFNPEKEVWQDKSSPSGVRKSPCFMLLMQEGLGNLARKAESLGIIHLRDLYSDSCELCHEIFLKKPIVDVMLKAHDMGKCL